MSTQPASTEPVDARKDFGEYIPITQLELPSSRGAKIHITTVHRWMNGIYGIRLKTLLMGRTRVTTKAWVQEFAEKVTAAREQARQARQEAKAREAGEVPPIVDTPPMTTLTPTQRTRATKATADIKKRWGAKI
jgi:hypothetical protein